jgi:predicted anti-sigma-YlaC factor YlaD
VNCEQAREAQSALLDGEAGEDERLALEEHLASCPDCVAWRDAVHSITRRTRIAVARPAPQASGQMLDAVTAAAVRQRRWPASTLAEARVALLLVACAQLAITVPQLIFGSDHDAPIHVAHEMGAFDMSLALGFIAAAWRPVYARGMQVLVGAAALLLITTAVIDLVAGRTSPVEETPHLLALAGWMLLRITAMHAPANDAPRQALAPQRSGARRESNRRGAPQPELARLSQADSGDLGASIAATVERTVVG